MLLQLAPRQSFRGREPAYWTLCWENPCWGPTQLKTQTNPSRPLDGFTGTETASSHQVSTGSRIHDRALGEQQPPHSGLHSHPWHLTDNHIHGYSPRLNLNWPLVWWTSAIYDNLLHNLAMVKASSGNIIHVRFSQISRRAVQDH